jgi:predicted GNAT family acetyltransferase
MRAIVSFCAPEYLHRQFRASARSANHTLYAREMASGPEIRDNAALDRFELFIDGKLAGIAEYQDTASERAFVHTEIYPEFSGQGLGRRLVQEALDRTREQGFGILPMCPMVLHFVQARPDYVALVPAWARERFGLTA